MDLNSIKIMILGLMILLIGGIISLDATITLRGFEIIIMIIGIVIGIIGFLKKDK